MTDFYERRAEELDEFLILTFQSLQKLNRDELEPLKRVTERIEALHRTEPLEAVKLIPSMQSETSKLDWKSLDEYDYEVYDSLRGDIQNFIGFELPRWLWRPQLKSAATDVIDSAWSLSVGKEACGRAYRELEDHYSELTHIVDDDSGALERFSECLANYEKLVARRGSKAQREQFQKASNRFVVEALLTEVV